jgi:gliding motility-associated-like protein
MPPYDVSNDTMFFDLSNAVYSGTGTYFYDIPVYIRSNGPISNFDFWFKFNQSELTYDSTINMVSALDPYSYFNPVNEFLSNTTSGPTATYTVPMNTVLLYVRFQLSGPCVLIDSSDFNTVTTLLNGSVCKHKFIDLSNNGSYLGINPSTICDGGLVSFTGPSSVNAKPVTSWSWNLGNGVTSSQQNTSTNYAAGSYTATLDVQTSDGCTFNFSQPSVSGQIPNASFTYQVSTGQDTVLFQNASDSASYLWIFGDGNSSSLTDPTNVYTGGGYYTVTLTADLNGCSSIVIDTILLDRPQALFSFTGNCTGDAINFTDLSTYANGSIVSWNWNFGDLFTSSFQNPSHVYAISGDYPVTLTVLGSNGISSIYTTTIQIDTKPIVLFNATQVTGCAPLSTVFNDQSFADAGAIYYWTFGDNTYSLLESPSKTYGQEGSYDVKLTISTPNGCVDSLLKPDYITVLYTPTADFIHSPACVNTDIQFTEIVTPGYENSSWNWTFGDGNTSTAQNPSHFYPSEGNFSVSLTVTYSNGCTNTLTQPLSIRNQPNANFSTIDTVGCVPHSATFTNLSTSSAGSGYTWDFGDGNQSNLFQPTAIFDQSGTFDVTLIATAPGGCADTSTIVSLIEVLSGVVADFTVDQHCVGVPTLFTDVSVSSSGNVNSWSWAFGNGLSGNSSSAQIIYNAPGTYDVTLSVVTDQGCSDTVVKPVIMDAKPIVLFTVPDQQGCIPFEVPFSNMTAAAPGSTYNWQFSNGQTSTDVSPLVVFDSLGNYTVELTVTTPNGCADSLILTDYIQLVNAPVASFDLLEDTLFIPEAISGVNNTSQLASSYTWDFGDGYTSGLQNPTHIYADTGSYQICLTALNQYGCSDTACDTIIVLETSFLAIPTAFTPNGDGANDLFLVRGGPFQAFQFEVFNEWGNRLFSSTDQSIGWDGTYSGQPQPSGTYEYIVTGVTLSGESVNEYGWVNLKRY